MVLQTLFGKWDRPHLGMGIFSGEHVDTAAREPFEPRYHWSMNGALALFCSWNISINMRAHNYLNANAIAVHNNISQKRGRKDRMGERQRQAICKTRAKTLCRTTETNVLVKVNISYTYASTFIANKPLGRKHASIWCSSYNECSIRHTNLMSALHMNEHRHRERRF